MEDKKFCKFCGEKIDKENVVCPMCGRQVDVVKKNEITSEKDKISTSNDKQKFYEQKWFMWVLLVIFAPVGIFFMWKFHPEMKKKLKIILTIVFTILFLIIAFSGNDGSDSTSGYGKNKKIEVTVIDFSTIEKESIDSWCSENKVNCNIISQYSDTAEKGAFISQSVDANTKIYEGGRITIVFSLGKKPPIEYTNALKKAESYSRTLNMSKKGIYDQLISEYGEKFSADAAQYAIDNIEVDWNANALAKAKSYQSTLNMSKNAIYDQLISQYGEQFTKEEAQYAIDHLND